MRWLGRLSAEEKRILAAMLEGSQLKSHRYLDGEKTYRLHPLNEDTNQGDGQSVALSIPVSSTAVESLRERGLIESNMKFPAATYLLTPKGERKAASLASSPLRPLTTRPAPNKQ
jgi:hypothetical protein